MELSPRRRPRVLVTIGWPVPALEEVADVRYGSLGDLPDADGLLASPTDRLTPAQLDELTELRAVAVAGAGTDGIPVEALARRGIVLVSAPEPTAAPTAELTLCLIVMANRGVDLASRRLRSGEWDGWSFGDTAGRGLAGLTLGLVGYGRIGREVARLATAFGMRVVHHARTPTGAAGYEPRLLDLLRQSDVVSLHVPLTSQTEHLIGRDELEAMPRGSVLVNTSRGNIVDEPALVDALRRGHLAGAGLDVFASEPQRPQALLSLPQVVVTPHIGTSTSGARSAMAERAATRLLEALG